MVQTYELSEQTKCVTLTIYEDSSESLQQSADDLTESLGNLQWDNAIVDIRPITYSLTIFEELMIVLKFLLRMPDDVRLGLLTFYLDSEDAAHLIRRSFAGEYIFGIFKTQDEAMAWLKDKRTYYRIASEEDAC
jgi:hypothetical protein